MTKVADFTGKKFGRLTVIDRFENTVRGTATWNCICDCGQNIVVRGNALQSGNTRSCGCLQREDASERFTTHGLRNSREWHIWTGMKQRCQNQNNPNYHDYAGRGITVCDEWQSFERFIADMGMSPTTKHTIERLDNNAGYYPSNCVWATRQQQSRNKRIQHNNKTGISGVYRRKNGTYKTLFRINGKQTSLGTYETLFDAACARKSAEARYWL